MSFGYDTASWQDAEVLAPHIAADEEQVRRGFWRKLRRLAVRLPFAEDLIAAHYCAFDRQTPLYVKVVLVGAIVYFVAPNRLIPKYVSLIGYTDDAAVIAAAVKLVASHITPDHREAARRTLARLRSEA
jgi:uncharacterized membrane protein YkvA (DUF1232 family)